MPRDFKMFDLVYCFQPPVIDEERQTIVFQCDDVATPEDGLRLSVDLSADSQDSRPRVQVSTGAFFHDHLTFIQQQQFPDHIPYLRRQCQEVESLLVYA